MILGLHTAHIIEASVLTFVLVAGFSGIIREHWAPCGAYYWGLCIDIRICGGIIRDYQGALGSAWRILLGPVY